MGELNAAIQSNLGLVVAVLAAAVLVLLALVALQAASLRRLRDRLDGLTRGADERSLEAVLDAHLDKVFEVARSLDEVEARLAVLEGTQRHALQRLGLVRFNPFDDTGGNQSFALAVLDADEHGFIVSSLHARSGTRLYAKALTHGRADGALSAEEDEALRLARSAAMGRAVVADRTDGRDGGVRGGRSEAGVLPGRVGRG